MNILQLKQYVNLDRQMLCERERERPEAETESERENNSKSKEKVCLRINLCALCAYKREVIFGNNLGSCPHAVVEKPGFMCACI